MKINKYSETMSDEMKGEYISALKDSDEAKVITDAPQRKHAKRRKRVPKF